MTNIKTDYTKYNSVILHSDAHYLIKHRNLHAVEVSLDNYSL